MDVCPQEVNGTKSGTDWGTVDWQAATENVNRLRQRIFRATQEGDLQKVKSLQKLMLRSQSNTLVGVRRVTQINQGKKTAGVDEKVAVTPQGRAMLVDEIAAHEPWKALPAKRVYIPKANGKQRPLGIPVIKDRALQAIVKNALEPFWESQFEATSYGFRPGRGCHDAICQVRIMMRGTTKKTWVVDADIEGAFDNIAHDYLKEVIGEFPAWELIHQWLKAGYVEAGNLYPTDSGTPQGGVISPLLANIALHGMEEALAVTSPSGATTRQGTRRDNRGANVGKRSVVRYADDFVVFTESKEDAEKVVEILEEWLALRGLRLSKEKTRIVHVSEGFDFLGFHLRQVEAPYVKSGFFIRECEKKVACEPSQKSLNKVKSRLRDEWEALQGANAQAVCTKLNPIIRGWANYFRIGSCRAAFRELDEFQWERQVRYVKRTHPNKPTKWTAAKYWGKLNPNLEDRWVFGDKETKRYLLKFRWFVYKDHIQVKGKHSPDDPDLQKYWEERALRKLDGLVPSKKSVALRQGGKCTVCGQPIFDGEWVAESTNSSEDVHLHHRQPRKDGGRNISRNFEIRHATCHWQAHRTQTNAERRAEAKRRPILEESYRD